MVKEESMLKKLLEESAKEKEMEEKKEKERLERLEKEKKEREKKKVFVFDEKDFPEFNKEEPKEKEKNNIKNNENKGGKKGKKKGKKKFIDIEEDLLVNAFKPEETPKPKWKKSSKHN